MMKAKLPIVKIDEKGNIDQEFLSAFLEALADLLPEINNKTEFPIEGFTDNSFKFGEEVEEWGKHLGQDFDVTEGVEVKSIADGIVVRSKLYPATDEKENWGNIIIIAHKYRGNLIFSLYGHLGLRNVDMGDKVKKGEEVGTVGKGYTPENGNWEEHLHFAIFKGEYPGYVLPGYDPPGNMKEWIDPMDFLKEII